MSEIDTDKLNEIWTNGWKNVDYSKCTTMTQVFEHLRNSYLESSQSVNESEKAELINRLDSFIDRWNVDHQENDPELCERCQSWAYAAQYCEHCIRHFFKKNFGKWTSGNDEIDKIIQDAQLNASCPDMVVEWIPFSDFEEVKHKIKGHRSDIYSATWSKGPFDKFNPETHAVDRFGRTNVILKKLENSDKMDGEWFKVITEFKLHKLSIFATAFYGITKDPMTQEYMIVLKQYDYNLHEYISLKHSKFSWYEKIYRANSVLSKIEGVNASSWVHKNLQPGNVHGNLHPGNVLYEKKTDQFLIADLGLYQHAEDYYESLPFIAPENFGCDE
ncbi:13746_t:CDS:2 [Acaulospora morrowiae]|uniref:13746_t:CDS:1 n=1 Tax=Acaulospora morrowiae TaxID=94023 RepID=A0A9N9GMR0_9GLOM|nr:13746_t:CDS:2 [Acaulospora morrowiae]